MIGALEVALADDGPRADVAGTERQRPAELAQADRGGTGAQDEEASGARRSCAGAGEPPHVVQGTGASRTSRRELRGITDDEVIASLAPGVRQGFDGITPLEAHSCGQPIFQGASGANLD